MKKRKERRKRRDGNTLPNADLYLGKTLLKQDIREICTFLNVVEKRKCFIYYISREAMWFKKRLLSK